MKEDLEKRVLQFNSMQLPGQPMGMHMGTSYLVNDLWREVNGLKKALQIHADAKQKKPVVICLCGSTRFADHHAVMRRELEKEGAIVLMINYLPAWYATAQGWTGNDHFGEKAGLKEHLDELHLRKIDLADRVMVINIGGYIGDSTRREIEYAKSTGKVVEYLEDPQELDSADGVEPVRPTN